MRAALPGIGSTGQPRLCQYFADMCFADVFAHVLQPFYRRVAHVLQTSATLCRHGAHKKCRRLLFADVLQTRPFGRRGAIESVKSLQKSALLQARPFRRRWVTTSAKSLQHVLHTVTPSRVRSVHPSVRHLSVRPSSFRL